MGAQSVEKRVASTAETALKLKMIPPGECWCFVHYVLAAANVRSFWDFQTKPRDPIFTPWGEEVDSPKQGYIVVLKDVVWHTSVIKNIGRGTVRTVRRENEAHQFNKHVAIILEVKKSGDIKIAQQGLKDDPDPSVGVVPLNHLERGEVKYYRPVAMPKGQKTSSPTDAAKEAAAGPKP